MSELSFGFKIADSKIGGFTEEDRSPAINPLLNTHSIIDHFCGSYVGGVNQEMIINGGANYINGMVGGGNQYKSTMADAMSGAVLENYFPVTNGVVYENESSRDFFNYVKRQPKNFKLIRDIDPTNYEKLLFTNHGIMLMDEYWEKRKEMGALKLKAKGVYLETPFLDYGNKEFIKIPAPTVELVDSWSMVRFKDTDSKFTDIKVDSNDRNTEFFRDGLVKTRLLMEMPSRNMNDGFYTFLTAHIQDKSQMGLGHGERPQKVLAHLKGGQHVANSTQKFYTVPNNLWYCHSQAPLWDGNRVPVYGYGEPGFKDDKDLVTVKILNLRGKTGSSGVALEVVCSQRLGFQPYLTALNFIRSGWGYYGMDSNTQNMSLDILPDLRFTRNSVRPLIDEHPYLARALELTAAWCQIRAYMPELGSFTQMSPKEIFLRVKEKGYDWDEILGGTSSNWSFNGQKREKQFLSPLDIMNMARGMYHPYWMSKPKGLQK